MLGSFWALANRVWLVGLLCFLPFIFFPIKLFLAIQGLEIYDLPDLFKSVSLIIYIGILLFLGVKGNQLAWKKNQWRSLEEFLQYQRNWTIVAIWLGIPINWSYLMFCWYLF